MKNCRILRQSICTILSGALLLMTGCTDKVSESSSGSAGNSITVFEVDTEKMPEIVFLKYTQYNKYASGNEGYQVYFIDKNGSVYYMQDISEDSVSHSYGITQIYDDFKSGKLDDKKSEKSCDKSELDDNFSKLCEVCSDKNYSIIYPDSMPDVEYDSVAWYGCYYDKDGEFRMITLHKSEGESLNSNNETANEIYSWFNGILTN